jgi:hypothetical protein
MSQPVCLAYTKRRFDVSRNQDNNDTPYFPILTRMKERGFEGVEIRITAGASMDEDFPRFLAEAVDAKFETIDVYSWVEMWDWKRRKISPREWGRIQARKAYSSAKAQPGFSRIRRFYADIENGSYASITTAILAECQEVLNGFYEELDRLTGKVTGNYNNQGYFWVLTDDMKKRPLWMSWYSRIVTIERVRQVLKNWNYTGKLEAVQFASDGDIDGDGISDARAAGMESTGLDLSVVIDDSAVQTTPTSPTPAAQSGWVTVTAPRGLLIRSGAGKGYDKVSSIVYGARTSYQSTAKDLAGNLWARISQGWICVRYGREEYAVLK